MIRHFREDEFEMREVCRVLGVRPEKVVHLCRMMELPVRRCDGELILSRSSVRRLYEALNPVYVPPLKEAA